MEPEKETQYMAKMYPNKSCTYFNWQLEDYPLLENYYGKFKMSPEFQLTSTNATCNLGFMHGNVKASVFLFFPIDLEFHTIRVKCSIIGELEKKIITKSKILPFDDAAKLSTYEKTSYQIELNLMPINKLLTEPGYLRDDTLNLLFEITLVESVDESSANSIISTDEDNDVFYKFDEYFMNGTFSDVTFLIDETPVHAHRIILAAKSPVFEAMFSTSVEELTERTVKVQDIDFATFEAFIRCLYTGSIERMEERAGKIIIAADKYQVLSVKKQCEEHIIDQMKSSNVIEYLLLAHKYNFGNIKKHALAIATSCLKEISIHPDFHQLCRDPDLLAEIVQKKK